MYCLLYGGVRFEPMPGLPNGVSGVGDESWHGGPGGYTLIEEEHIPTPGGAGYLLGIFWWVNVSKQIRGMECNNQLPSTCDLKASLRDITVTWDGKTSAVHEIETHEGKTTVWHDGRTRHY